MHRGFERKNLQPFKCDVKTDFRRHWQRWETPATLLFQVLLSCHSERKSFSFNGLPTSILEELAKSLVSRCDVARPRGELPLEKPAMPVLWHPNSSRTVVESKLSAWRFLVCPAASIKTVIHSEFSGFLDTSGVFIFESAGLRGCAKKMSAKSGAASDRGTTSKRSRG
jgi:hypothetical protein